MDQAMSTDILHELLEDPKSPGHARAKVAETLYGYAVRASEVAQEEGADLPLSSIRVELWASGRVGSRRCLNALVNVLRFDGARWAFHSDFPPDALPFKWKGRGQLGSCYFWIEGTRPEAFRAVKQPGKDLYKVPLYSYQERGPIEQAKHAIAFRPEHQGAYARDVYFCDLKTPVKRRYQKELDI